MITHKYVALTSNVDEMIEPIVQSLNDLNVDKKVIYKIHLCLEELLANVASYAYYPKQGEVEVSHEIKQDPRHIVIQIVDSGKPFNPLEVNEPDLDASLEDRQVGGLGLFIVKKTMDEIAYQREDNKNILIVKKNI